MRRPLLLTLLLASLLGAAPARAGVANAGLPGAPAADPLAGLRWGNYDGRDDEVFPAYRAASGRSRQLLGLIATRPRMRWYGQWYGDSYAAAREYVDNVTARDPDALVQVAVFAMVPWEGEACRRLPSPAEQARYRSWIDGFAAGIGDARTALVLQPDLPFGLCAPRHSALPLSLISWAARRFSALPHTTVYLDAGASDWESAGQASWMLRQAGVRYIRGFALDTTHYASTADQIRYGSRVSAALAARGVKGKHFVINTAENGAPFTYQQYHRSDFDNATACRHRGQRRCVTLGIPPTADVASPRWGLSAGLRRAAAQLVDGYLWIGRPWLYNQSDPFDRARALALAATTPF